MKRQSRNPDEYDRQRIPALVATFTKRPRKAGGPGSGPRGQYGNAYDRERVARLHLYTKHARVPAEG